jgi:hypothetical protein
VPSPPRSAMVQAPQVRGMFHSTSAWNGMKAGLRSHTKPT